MSLKVSFVQTWGVVNCQAKAILFIPVNKVHCKATKPRKICLKPAQQNISEQFDFVPESVKDYNTSSCQEIIRFKCHEQNVTEWTYCIY